MMKYPLANLLVVRKVAQDLEQSCFAQLQRAINMLKVSHLWKSTVSPLKLTYIPTGQKIIFRGLDKWSSITSMTTDSGYLCWCWIEEAYEIEEDGNMKLRHLNIFQRLNIAIDVASAIDYLHHQLLFYY